MRIYRAIFLLPGMIILIMHLGALSSCQNENKEDLFGLECDTVNVSFSADIQAILQSNCLHCHYDQSPVAPFSLQTYENVKLRVETGQLEPAVNHYPGAPRMPRDGPRLPDCELSKINIWIREGAPNN